MLLAQCDDVIDALATVVVASGLFLLWRETAARQLVAQSSSE